MRTTIKTTSLILILSFLICLNLSAQQAYQVDGENEAKVVMYYFHFNARCATCRAIESKAQLNVKELFGNDVSFTACNLDKPEGESKGKELGINSQALLVVKGDKKINLIKEGFMYARTNPEKFKQIIEEKIKPLL